MEPNAARQYLDNQVNARTDEARKSLQDALNQRFTGTLREAAAQANRILFALQVLNPENAITEQTFKMSILAEPTPANKPAQ